MNLFVGSVAVICAFVVGVLLGARLLWKIVSRRGGMFDRMSANASAQHVMATGYGYEQVLRRFQDGASAEEIRAFVEAELDRLAEAGQQVGARMGHEMTDDWRAEKP